MNKPIHFFLRTSASVFAIVGVLTLSGCSNDAQDGAANIEQIVNQGDLYRQQGQFRAAMIEARNVIQASPDAMDGHLLMAKILNDLGDSRGAANALKPFVNNQDANLQLELAEAYVQRRKFKSALNLLNQHPELQAEDPSSYLDFKARAQLGQNKPTDAQASYQQLFDIDNKSITALLGLATIDHANKQLDAVQERLKAAEALDSENPRVELFRAAIAAQNNDTATAETHLTNTLSYLPSTDIMTPLKTSTLRALSQLLTQQGRTSEAMTYSKLLADANPNALGMQSRFNEAMRLFKDKKLDEAKSALEALLAEAPGHELSNQLLGFVHYLQGDIERSNDILTSNLDLELATPQAKHILALTNMHLRQPKLVLDILKDEVAISNNIQMLSLYGAALLSDGQVQEGEQYVQKAYDIDPGNALTSALLAKFHMSKSEPQYGLADEILQTGLKQSPSNHALIKILFELYTRQGKSAEADKLVKETLANDATRYLGHQMAGEQALRDRDFSAAAEQFSAAAALDTNAHILRQLGATALWGKDFELAEATFKALSAQFPDDPMGYKGQISAAEAAGDAAPALEVIRSLAEEENIIAANQVLAEYFIKNEKPDQAEGFVDRIFINDPNNAAGKGLRKQLALLNARTMVKAGNNVEARSTLQGLLDTQADNQQALALLIQIAILDKDFAQAQSGIDTLAPLNKQAALMLAGESYLKQGFEEKSLAIFQESWQEAPSDAAGRQIYRLLSNRNEKEGAEFSKEWAEALPESPDANFMASTTALAKEDFSTAEIHLTKLVNMHPTSAIALNNLAWVQFKLNKKISLETAIKAAELASDNGQVLDTLGWILFNHGDSAKSLVYLKKAAELEPKNDDIHKHLEAVRMSLNTPPTKNP